MYYELKVIAGAAPQTEMSKMSTRTISIEEISALSKEGRVALRHSAEFGQTAVGAHCAISAERRVVIEVSPTGVGYEEGSALTIYSAREAGEGRVFFDPATGRAWWGAAATLRVLSDSAEPLEDGYIVKDAANAAYQKALLRGSA